MEQEVLEQLHAIYSKENLEKDNFFREMTQQHPEGWITLKKLSLIKRFKSLINGDVSILVAAANMAPEKFEINEDQTKLRALSSAESEDTKPTEDERLENVKGYWLTQNQRSIYAKGFPQDPEPTKADLMKFFEEFGRVIHIKYRREDDQTFKGSIFVEFESNEMAASVLEKEHCYEGNDLLVMNKQAYVEMKAKGKYDGESFGTCASDKKMRHYVEFSGPEDLGFSGVKEILSSHDVKVGRFEFVNNQKGVGVVQLWDEMTADQFLATLQDNKLGPLSFRLASDETRSEYRRIAKERREKYGGDNRGRGRGRNHRGFKRQQNGKQNDKAIEKRPRND